MSSYFRIVGQDHLVSQGGPILFWLRELSLVHEAECTIMLQSKPVDPGNVANKSASCKNEKVFFDNGQLDNSKIEKMDTGIITDDEILYIYIYIYYK